jgi:hypothetical protein
MPQTSYDAREADQFSTAPQFLRVMHERFQAEHAFAFGINLQGQAATGDLEHRQIIPRFLDHDSPAPGRAVLAVKSGTSFVPQESLDALNPHSRVAFLPCAADGPKTSLPGPP